MNPILPRHPTHHTSPHYPYITPIPPTPSSITLRVESIPNDLHNPNKEREKMQEDGNGQDKLENQVCPDVCLALLQEFYIYRFKERVARGKEEKVQEAKSG